MQHVVRNFPSTNGRKDWGLCPYLAFIFWVTNERLASGGTVFNFFSLSTHFFQIANKFMTGTSLVSLCSWFIAVRCSVNVCLEVALVQFITSNLNSLRACHYFLWSFQILVSSYIMGTPVLCIVPSHVAHVSEWQWIFLNLEELIDNSAVWITVKVQSSLSVFISKNKIWTSAQWALSLIRHYERQSPPKACTK